MTISSYDREAVRPLVGTLWVWELDEPHACELIRVTSVRWNGEEWWVRTEHLYPTLKNTYYPDRGAVQLNDLSRFWEACRAVAAQPGPPRGRAVRAGPAQPGEADAPATISP